MDIFFGSCRSVFWRRKSDVKVARYLVLIFLCIWTLLDLPYCFLQDLILNVQSGRYTCVTTNGTYALFRSYFIVVGLYVVIPVITISVFGFLTYRQLQKLTAHQRRSLSALAKQMTRMVLFEIIIVLIFVTPYALTTIYFVATANMIKSVYRLAQESVIQVVFNIYGYGALSSSFYCYYIASKRFRDQVRNVVHLFLWNQRRNQVVPIQRASSRLAIAQQQIRQA